MTTACFITARLKSKRLPKKVLKNLNGKPMLLHLVERLKLSQECKKIVLCTSTVSQDDPLEEFAYNNDIDIFRGHPDDVMTRLKEAAEKFNINLIASCTADNPLIDPYSMDQLIRYHKESNSDFCKSENLPFGCFTMTVTFNSLVKACSIKDTIETEFWPQYFLKSGLFKVNFLHHNDISISRPLLRLTVDEQKDFDLMNKIFKALDSNNKLFSLSRVVEFLENNPSIAYMNSHVKQKNPPQIILKKQYINNNLYLG